MAVNSDTERLLETLSKAAHEAWMESKLAQGVESRQSEWGEELMVPYTALSDQARDLDRGTVRGVLDAIDRADFVVAPKRKVFDRSPFHPLSCQCDDCAKPDITATIIEAITELDAAHRPLSSDPLDTAEGRVPIGCVTCWPGEGKWPCVSRMVADDLRAALAKAGAGKGDG
jgi:hypothetical protein